MGSSYAPLQFLRSPWNNDVWTAIDNQIDQRTTLVLYLGQAATLPTDLDKYQVGCILIHKADRQIYFNTGTDVTPTWEAFGPGTSGIPTPLEAGKVLTNDGSETFWALVDLSSMVTGQLNSTNINLNSLTSSTEFINLLVANDYFTTLLANSSNFVNELTNNTVFQTLVNNFVTGGGNVTFSGIAQKPRGTNSVYDELIGDIDGVNKVFTVPGGKYVSGSLVVILNGLTLNQGDDTDWFELDPSLGTFEFVTEPEATDVVTVLYAEEATTPVSPLEVEENGVSIETNVSKINILTNSPIVTSPATGEIEIDLTNISGGLGGGGTKIAIDTDETSNATTTPVDAFTIPIPANTLGTNDAIRFTITGSTDGGTGNGETTVTYGGQSLGTVTKTGSHDFVINGFIIADNSDNAQKTQLQLIIDGSPQEVINGALTVDSTGLEDLVVSIVSTSTREITTEAIIVEKITAQGGGVNNIIQGTAKESITQGDVVFKAEGNEVKAFGTNTSGNNFSSKITDGSGDTEYLATKFTIPYDCIINQLVYSFSYVRRATWTVQLRDVSGGLPGPTTYASSTGNGGSNSGLVPTYVELNNLNLSATAGQEFFLVVSVINDSTSSAESAVRFCTAVNDATNQTSFRSNNGTTWTATSEIYPAVPVIKLIPEGVYKADVDIYGMNNVGFALSSQSVGTNINVQVSGEYTTSGLTPNSKYYISDTVIGDKNTTDTDSYFLGTATSATNFKMYYGGNKYETVSTLSGNSGTTSRIPIKTNGTLDINITSTSGVVLAAVVCRYFTRLYTSGRVGSGSNAGFGSFTGMIIKNLRSGVYTFNDRNGTGTTNTITLTSIPVSIGSKLFIDLENVYNLNINSDLS